MLRVLFFTSLCLVSSTLLAQKPVKPKFHKTDTTDYQVIGAPMPKLIITTLFDTAKEKHYNVVIDKKESHKKKRIRQNEFDHNLKLHEKLVVTQDDLNNDANLFVMMFNPNCSHCEDMTEEIEKYNKYFVKSKWVMVAHKTNKILLPNFIKSFKINDYPFMYIGADSVNFNDNAYMFKALPQINIYDHNRKLIKYYAGDIPMDSLAAYIE